VYYDVRADNEKLDEMLRYSKGERKVPVIVEGDNVSIGYAGGS
jgi:glutaredoxin